MFPFPFPPKSITIHILGKNSQSKGETIMAKLFKKILGAAAVGTAAAGALYYWKKNKIDTDEFEDDFEDEEMEEDEDDFFVDEGEK